MYFVIVYMEYSLGPWVLKGIVDESGLMGRLLFLQTLQVIYPYSPQNDDELELVPGDFIFMSPMEQTSTSEGWIYGTSLTTGCSGLLPENYITKADECSTWIFHG